MKQGKWWMCGLAAMLMLTWSYTAAQGAAGGREKGKKAQAGGRGEARPGGESRGGGGMFGSFDFAAVAKEMDLSPAQSEKLTGLILNQMMAGMLQRLNLDDAQKAKAKDVCMGAAKDVLGGDRSAMRRVMETIRSDVLTDDQKAKMGGGPGRREGGEKGGEKGRAKDAGGKRGKAGGEGT